QYRGAYFFADFCGRWIKTIDPQTGEVSTFATDTAPHLADLDVDSQGDLYYVSWNETDGGQLRKIAYVPQSPPVVAPLQGPEVVAVGDSATFEVVASGALPFEYQWLRDDQPIDGAVSPTYTIPATQLSDD